MSYTHVTQFDINDWNYIGEKMDEKETYYYKKLTVEYFRLL